LVHACSSARGPWSGTCAMCSPSSGSPREWASTQPFRRASGMLCRRKWLLPTKAARSACSSTASLPGHAHGVEVDQDAQESNLETPMQPSDRGTSGNDRCRCSRSAAWALSRMRCFASPEPLVRGPHSSMTRCGCGDSCSVRETDQQASFHTRAASMTAIESIAVVRLVNETRTQNGHIKNDTRDASRRTPRLPNMATCRRN
jgi:hypothetical protein